MEFWNKMTHAQRRSFLWVAGVFAAGIVAVFLLPAFFRGLVRAWNSSIYRIGFVDRRGMRFGTEGKRDTADPASYLSSAVGGFVSLGGG